MKPSARIITASFCLCVATATAQLNMFRSDATHGNAFATKQPGIFGEEAWTFNAGAPVRSSVAFNSRSIFFGAANGLFYAVNKTNGQLQWTFDAKAAIHSTAAVDANRLYFTDNHQTLYCLDAISGKKIWQHEFDKSLEYLWAFDYYYSSPAIVGNSLFIGAKDGCLYRINKVNGEVKWKFKTNGIVRSSPAVKDGIVFIGDTEGNLFAVNAGSGKEKWQFHSMGHSLNNEEFGYDRKAFISSPVIARNKLLAGCRDGILYAVNIADGKEAWRMDHEVSWVISSVAVKDSFVVTGSSDGHFVQAVNLNTGKEYWRFPTVSIIWSSPVIYNNTVYIGSDEGILYALDLLTGKRVHYFQASGNIFSSPVIVDSLLYFGSDNGKLYALKTTKRLFAQTTGVRKYVYYEKGLDYNFRYGTDLHIRNYLAENGYKVINNGTLIKQLSLNDSAENSVIVFASSYFPNEITTGNKSSLLRRYLDKGGKVVIVGNNPLIYRLDSATQRPFGFDFKKADSVLGIDYGYNDVRAFGGVQPAHPTSEGEAWGLKRWWTSFLPLDPSKVDIVLGKDENGFASAWVKNYSSNKAAGFVQVWVDVNGTDDLSYIMNVAEYGLGEK